MAPKALADAKAKAKPKPKPKAKADVEKDETEYMPKPDREAMQEKQNAVQKQIEDLQKKKKALEGKIESGKGVKDEYFSKKKEISAKIQGFKEKIDACHTEKEKYQQGVNEKKGERNQMAQDMKKARAAIGYKSEEDMDKRMREIEYSLQTDTMPLKKEKELLKEMSELKRNRSKVAEVNKMGARLDSFEVGGNKETLDTINKQIRAWMEQKGEALKERKVFEEEYQGKLGDTSVYEDRKKLNEKIAALAEERNKIRDAFKEEENKYWEAWKKKKQEQQEKYAAERKARQAEWEERDRQRRVEKIDDQPFVAEITLIEQTIKFCKSLASGKEEKQEEEKKEVDHSKNNMDGLQVLEKKDERDEFWFEPTKGKKSKGSKQKGEKAGSAKPIKHSAQTFKLFDQLKLDAPITLDDIPQILEKLEAKLVHFHKKVAEWEKTKEEKKAKILAGGDVEDDKKDKAESKKDDKKDEAESKKDDKKDEAESKEEEKEEKEEEEKAEEKDE